MVDNDCHAGFIIHHLFPSICSSGWQDRNWFLGLHHLARAKPLWCRTFCTLPKGWCFGVAVNIQLFTCLWDLVGQNLVVTSCCCVVHLSLADRY